MSSWSLVLFLSAMPMSALSSSGLLSVEKVFCCLEMNKLKFFALAILFVLQHKKYMGS